MVQNVIAWNQRFDQFPQLIFQGLTQMMSEKLMKKGVRLSFSVSKIALRWENNIGLVEVCHQLGVRFMQLSYNNQTFWLRML
ncbi:MAG: hypothetical protein CM1200mP30_19700 [Pseudomonadota bacterium]|nr:MAG: hypothetical protein CM1200mP30_19700 [Pseudomonadota bacterium]